ncbi:MAG: methylated-DNA--[protein]-cysteine S-methyltransferase [Dokdonella sp.]
MTLYFDYLETPIGRLLLVGDGDALVDIDLPLTRKPTSIGADWQHDGARLADVKQQLGEYFDGQRADFDVPLAPRGTQFQLTVWQALRDIPYASTISYGELARRIGNPNASRAVGLANGANPLSIIVPCHRVIGSSGEMTGYGGGVETKRFLLDLERRHADRHVAAEPFQLGGD